MKTLFRQPIIAVAIINAAVAIMAFAKDIGLAAYLGTSVYADALSLAFFLPDSLGNNLMASAIAVSCVPVFSRLIAQGQLIELRQSLITLVKYITVISVIIVVAGLWFSAPLSVWLSGAGKPELSAATRPLLQILLPAFLLFQGAALGSAYLQAQQRFLMPAAAPLWFNLVFASGIAYCFAVNVPLPQGVYWIAAVILAGITVMAVSVSVSASKVGRNMIRTKLGSQGRDIKSNHPAEMFKLFLPYSLILLTMQLVYFAERLLLTRMDTGAVAALNYAFRVTQVPIWIFVAAVSAVILPSLSRHLALGEHRQAEMVMAHASRSLALIVLPSMLFLFVLREPVTIALFQRGAFDEHSVLLTTSLLEGYTLSIVSQAFSLIILRYFLATGQLKRVVAIFSAGCLLTIALDVWLLNWIGYKGIGYGAALGALVQAVMLVQAYTGRIRKNNKALKRELRQYMAVFALPLLLLSVFAWLWHGGIAVHISSLAYVAAAAVGCITLYVFAIWWKWNELFKAAVSVFRKG